MTVFWAEANLTNAPLQGTVEPDVFVGNPLGVPWVLFVHFDLLFRPTVKTVRKPASTKHVNDDTSHRTAVVRVPGNSRHPVLVLDGKHIGSCLLLQRLDDASSRRSTGLQQESRHWHPHHGWAHFRLQLRHFVSDFSFTTNCMPF